MSEPTDRREKASDLAGSMRPRDAEQRERQLKRYGMEWPASLREEFAFRDAERDELVSLLRRLLEWLWDDFGFRVFAVNEAPEAGLPRPVLPGLLELQVEGWDALGRDFFDFARERWDEAALQERGHWPAETPAMIEFWRRWMRRVPK